MSFNSFIPRNLIAVAFLVLTLFHGCCSEEVAYHADDKAFLNLMRTVEIGPMCFTSMAANDVLCELFRVGNEALEDARSSLEDASVPLGFSFMAKYPDHVNTVRRDWNIPRMPILCAIEYVCQSCGLPINYEGGLFLINFKVEEETSACKQNEGSELIDTVKLIQ